jgi:hypothetical protein
MFFRFHSNHFSRATKKVAAGLFIVAMLFMGFAALIFAIPELFGYLAAIAFFLIGLSLLGYAVRLFAAAGDIEKQVEEPEQESYRRNVQIHSEIESEDF